MSESVHGSLRVWTEPGPGELHRVRTVEIVEPEPNVHHVQLDDSNGTRLGVALPRGAKLPIVVGQRLDVRTRFEVRGIHPVAHATVIDSDTGALLLALSGAGDPSWAPGWSVALGPERGRSRGRIDFWVELSVSDHCIRVAGNQWSELETPSARWLVCGHAVGWDPTQPLMPDASSYHCYELLRVR